MLHIAKKLKSDRIISFDPTPEETDKNAFTNNFMAILPSTSNGKNMAQQVMEISYDDYTVDTNLMKKRTDAALQLFKSSCAETTQPYEVLNTSDQSISEEWEAQWFMRITSSNAKEVVSVRTDSGKYRLMKRILWGYKLPKLKALTYGKNNEVNALNAYQALMASFMRMEA